jgi:hypothetical protein
MDLDPSLKSASKYRQSARSCIEAALGVSSQEACVILLDLAFLWTRLAQQIEKSDERDLGSSSIRALIVRPRRH